MKHTAFYAAQALATMELWLSFLVKAMALGLENTVTWFKKNSFHSYQTKNLSAHVASKPGSGLARVGWETVHAGKQQPLPSSSSAQAVLLK